MQTGSVAFIVGAEAVIESRRQRVSVGIVPEAYWRVLLPARALRAPAMATMRALRSERPHIAWIHEPLSEAALTIAREVKALGGLVVADFSEDAWVRDECGEGVTIYTSSMLRAADAVTELADVVVVAHAALGEVFGGKRVEVIEPRLPGLLDMQDCNPGVISWWTDGRQRAGLELAGSAVTAAVEAIDGQFWHIGFWHMNALHLPVSRQHIIKGDNAIAHLQKHAGMAEVAVDCWPAVSYRDTVSDLGILRMAALGVPTITNRAQAPPGCVSAPCAEWPDIIRDLHESPESRRALALAGRQWAATRVGFEPYQALLESLEAR